MTEVLFYHLQNMSLENVLPPLLEKSRIRTRFEPSQLMSVPIISTRLRAVRRAGSSLVWTDIGNSQWATATN